MSKRHERQRCFISKELMLGACEGEREQVKVGFRFLARAPQWMLFFFTEIVNRRAELAAEVLVQCVEFEIMATDGNM